MTEIQELGQLPNLLLASKKQLTEAGTLAGAALTADGQASALERTVLLAKVGVYVDAYRAALADTALSEREQYAEKQLTILGAKVEVAETGVRYDYSQDAEWQRLSAAEAVAVAARKAREDLLKSIRPGVVCVDAESGETLAPPARFSKTTVRVTL